MTSFWTSWRAPREAIQTSVFQSFWGWHFRDRFGCFLLMFRCLLDALWERCGTFFASFWTSWGVPRGMIQPSIFHFGGLTLFVWVFLLLIFGRSLGTFSFLRGWPSPAVSSSPSCASSSSSSSQETLVCIDRQHFVFQRYDPAGLYGVWGGDGV